MQLGSIAVSDEGAVRALLLVLDKFRDSVYHPQIRSALSLYLHRNRRELASTEAQEIIKAVGIREGLFPEDKHLDRIVRIDYPQQTPLAEVVASVSAQAKVPLAPDDELKRRTLSSYPRTWTLREMMVSLAAYKAEWKTDGKGYRLVPKEDKPPQYQKQERE